MTTGGQIGDFSLASDGRPRVSFANTHLRTAREFALEVSAIQRQHQAEDLGDHFDGITAKATATVLCAVAALDAFIAEIQFDHESTFPGQGQAALDEFKRVHYKSIRVRLESMAALNGRAMLSWDQGIGQQLIALIELRNALVHFTPEWPSESVLHERVSLILTNKFEPTPYRFVPPERIFPRRWASYSCCKWAVETVRSYALAYAAHNGWPCSFTKPVHGALPLP